MNPLPTYKENGELDNRLRVDPVTGDVGIGTPKLKTKDEPVGWIDSKGYMICVKTDESCRPLYATPQREYERGFIDGMQKQMQSSVDKAVNAMGKREWVGLTDEEVVDLKMIGRDLEFVSMTALCRFARDIEAKLKEKNGY
jgi:hypothetical protein